MDTYQGYTLRTIQAMNRRASNAASAQLAALNARVSEPAEDLELFRQHLRGTRVLDVGCGWGYYAQRFADFGLEYRGIDASPGMIEASRIRNPNLQFDVMSFRKPAFPAKSFDGLWACCSLYYEPKANIQNVFRGLHRVLVPGGIFGIVERLSYVSGEYVANSSIANMPMYFSEWEYDEFKDAIEQSPFTILDSFERENHGSMTFILRK